MTELIAGAITMGYLVGGAYFFKFWQNTEDRLFLGFTSAFLLLAIQRVALVVLPGTEQSGLILYTVRLFAFLIILLAILDKNRASA